MDTDLDTRLKQAVLKRDNLAAETQRVQGKKEAADTNLKAVEAEVRKANLDPDTLDDTIAQLGDAYQIAVTTLETDLSLAEKALDPYLTDPK